MKTTLAVVALLTLVFALSGCGAGRVTVPNVRGKDPGTAYELLHKAGLKVSISGGFLLLLVRLLLAGRAISAAARRQGREP